MPHYRVVTAHHLAHAQTSATTAPTQINLAGTVHLVPEFEGPAITWPGVTDDFIRPEPVEAQLVSGELLVGGSPLSLLVSDDPEANQQWTWRLRHTAVTLSGRQLDLPDFVFAIPLGDRPFEITEGGGVISGGRLITTGPPGPAGPDGRDEDGRLHSTPLGTDVFFEDMGDAVATASDAYLLGQELLRINQQLTIGTGARNLTSLVSDATGGQVLISRRGPVVELALVNLLLSGAAAWSQLLTLPVGFRPALAAAEAALIPQGSSSGVISVRRSDGRVDINRLGPTVRHKLTFTYMTGDPWPTVLPGTPA